MKVYQVYYNYTETYCSPNPENWTDERHVVAMTLDEEYANELAAEHNKHLDGVYSLGKNQRAYVESYDLVSRP